MTYIYYKKIIIFITTLLFFSPLFANIQIDNNDTNSSDTLIDTIIAKRTGDLDKILKSRVIRVLVIPSRTMYYVDKGKKSGVFYEMMTAFEKNIQKRYPSKNKHIKIQVTFIPVSRDKLIPGLIEGIGDIAVADISITPKRKELIDFSDPFFHNINQIVITGPSSPKLHTIDDLSGKIIFVTRSSSYWEYLEKLNIDFSERGLAPIILKPVPEQLEDGDLMEMVDAGLIDITVVDDYKAKLWSQVLPNIVLHKDIAIKTGDEFAWMIRKDSPLLVKEVNKFVKGHKEGTLFGNILLNRYIDKSKFIKRATSQKELTKFIKVVDLFRKYSDQYDLNYLLMLAQGYQESKLNQKAKSRVGAIGIMQLMPSTGKEMKVGNIKKIESNIHAGIKYHQYLSNRYFKDENMTELNRTLFSLAAYNAGPSRVIKLRKEARKRGLNPNVWFDNVEFIAAEKIGSETVTYISNIFKYYVGYKLYEEKKEESRKVKESLLPNSKQN